jgi:hypothetical protein
MNNQEIFKIESKETTNALISQLEIYGGCEDISIVAKRLSELLQLVDGAYDIIEIYDASSSPYNTEWRKQWLQAARECGVKPTW